MADQRCLAGPVLADQRDALARRDLQVDPVEGTDWALGVHVHESFERQARPLGRCLHWREPGGIDPFGLRQAPQPDRGGGVDPELIEAWVGQDLGRRAVEDGYARRPS